MVERGVQPVVDTVPTGPAVSFEAVVKVGQAFKQDVLLGGACGAGGERGSGLVDGLLQRPDLGQQLVEGMVDGGVGRELRVLLGDGDAAAGIGAALPGGRFDGAGEHAEQGGFAAPVVAHQGELVTGMDGQTDRVEHGGVGVPDGGVTDTAGEMGRGQGQGSGL